MTLALVPCACGAALHLARKRKRRGAVVRQPTSTFGSPEHLVERGTENLARATLAFGKTIAARVDGKVSAKTIRKAIDAAAKAWPRARFAAPLGRELLHAQMLGALDAHFEASTNQQVGVASFTDLHPVRLLAGGADNDTDPAFAKRPQVEATREFAAREVVTRDVFDQMTTAAQRRSFTVANAATKEIADTVKRELVRQVAQGAELRDFKKHALARLESAGWTPQNPSHAENVLRTNALTAYNAGRYRQMTQPSVLRLRPNWQIVTVNDGPPRQRKAHQDAHLAVLRADDPFWQSCYPPFGYQCRCRVRSLGRRDDDKVESGSSLHSRVSSPGLPDPGFASGTSELMDAPPVPPVPPPPPEGEAPANDTIPPRAAEPEPEVPSRRPANDTVPPPSKKPALPAEHQPLDTPEKFNAHLQQRGAGYTPDHVHERAKELFGRHLTPAEIDTFIGHDAFSSLQGPRGLTVDVREGALRFEASVGANYRDTEVDLIRTFRHEDGELRVHHDLLKLPERNQGSGIGPRVISAQLASYETLGVKQIDLDAAWVGRYYWPKLGFDVEPRMLKNYTEQFAAYLERRGAPPRAVVNLTKGIKSMRDIAITKVGDKNLGKDFLLGDVLDPARPNERGTSSVGGIINNLRMAVKPGDPVYENMKREVSK